MFVMDGMLLHVKVFDVMLGIQEIVDYGEILLQEEPVLHGIPETVELIQDRVLDGHLEPTHLVMLGILETVILTHVMPGTLLLDFGTLQLMGTMDPFPGQLLEI